MKAKAEVMHSAFFLYLEVIPGKEKRGRSQVSVMLCYYLWIIAPMPVDTRSVKGPFCRSYGLFRKICE